MASSDEITLKELVKRIQSLILFLFYRWKILLLAGFLGGLMGGLYAQFQKPTYTATLSFALEDDKSGGGGISGALGLASSLGFDIGGGAGGAFAGNNLTELIKSRRIVEQTLLAPVITEKKTISLAEYYIEMKGWRKKWQNDPGNYNTRIVFSPNSNRDNFSVEQDSILSMIYETLLKGTLNVEQKDKKVSIINLVVKSGDQFFAKNFVESLAKEVSDFYIDTKSKKAKLNLSILEKQTDSIRSELNAAITGVASANDNTYNLNPALNVRRTPSLKRQIDVQANTAILTELVKNLELAKVTLRKETPLIQIIDKPRYPLNKEKLGRLRTAVFGSIIVFFIVSGILIIRRWWIMLNNNN